MELTEALKLIKEKLKTDVVESNHFKEQCVARNLDAELVKKVSKENKILGIIEQADNQYKVWFYYEKDKDLNIVVGIVSSGRLKLVTVFPCKSERRTR